MRRREFLAVTATAAFPQAVAASTAPPSPADKPAEPTKLARPKETMRGAMRYRLLGRTGEEVSLIGLGGHHIGRQKDEQESIAHHPRRHRRRHQLHGQLLGLPRRRQRDPHGQGPARRLPQEGLPDDQDRRPHQEGRRRADRPVAPAAADRLHRPVAVPRGHSAGGPRPDLRRGRGAWRRCVAAQKAGKVRFIGFTGHKDPLVHLRMLEVAAKHGFRFDAVQMPLNVMDAHFRSFEQHVLPVLVKEGIGVLGMKPMGDGLILKSKTVTPVECLHYAMSSADLDGHHRHRQHGDPRAGSGGGQDIPAAHGQAVGRSAGPNQSRRPPRAGSRGSRRRTDSTGRPRTRAGWGKRTRALASRRLPHLVDRTRSSVHCEQSPPPAGCAWGSAWDSGRRGRRESFRKTMRRSPHIAYRLNVPHFSRVPYAKRVRFRPLSALNSAESHMPVSLSRPNCRTRGIVASGQEVLGPRRRLV